jgi:hypothetical protein
VQGQLGGQLIMVQVRVTDALRVGDTVVSAGLVLTDDPTGAARSLYPRGLLIGTVRPSVTPTASQSRAFVRCRRFPAVERLVVSLRRKPRGCLQHMAPSPRPERTNGAWAFPTTLGTVAGADQMPGIGAPGSMPPGEPHCRTASESRSSPR